MYNSSVNFRLIIKKMSITNTWHLFIYLRKPLNSYEWCFSSSRTTQPFRYPLRRKLLWERRILEKECAVRSLNLDYLSSLYSTAQKQSHKLLKNLKNGYTDWANNVKYLVILRVLFERMHTWLCVFISPHAFVGERLKLGLYYGDSCIGDIVTQ